MYSRPVCPTYRNVAMGCEAWRPVHSEREENPAITDTLLFSWHRRSGYKSGERRFGMRVAAHFAGSRHNFMTICSDMANRGASLSGPFQAGLRFFGNRSNLKTELLRLFGLSFVSER